MRRVVGRGVGAGRRTQRRIGISILLLAFGLPVGVGPAEPVDAAPLTWTDVNPDVSDSSSVNATTGGRTNGLSSVPGSSTTFYAATEWGGLYKTTNGGTSWSFLGEHLPTATWDVEVDPTSTSRVVATSFFDGRTDPITGIQVSTDGGATWTRPASATPTVGDNCASAERRTEPSAFGIGIHPTSGDMYVGTNCGVAVSSDGGVTWTFVDPTPGDAADDVWDVVVQDDGSTDGIVDVCGDDGVLRSTDGGGNWTSLNGDLPLGLAFGRCSIGASPDEAYVGFVNFGQRFFESDNLANGNNWSEFTGISGTGSRIPFLTVNDRSGTSGRDFDLWIGAGVNLFRAGCTTPDPEAVGGGQRCPGSGSWVAADSGAHVDTGDVAFDGAATVDACPEIYASDGGVHTNTNATSPGCHTPSWAKANVGLHALWLFTMSGFDVAGAADEDLYGGGQDNGNYYTGKTSPTAADWTNPDCCDVFDIIGNASRTVYTQCCFSGALQLRRKGAGLTGGATQINLPPGCCVAFTFEDVVVEYDTDDYAVATTTGLFITNDITASPVVWTQLGAGTTPAGGFCGLQFANFGANPTFYAQTRCDSGPNSIGESLAAGQLWRFDGTTPGDSWTRVDNTTFAGGISKFAVDPTDETRLYASNLGGTEGVRMMFSTDGGTSWQLDPDLDAMMVGDPLHTGNDAFEYVTERGPTGFTSLSLGYRQPTLLAFDPEDPNVIVAGGRDSGVFVSTNGGDDWALLSDPFTPTTTGRPHLPRPRYAYFDHDAADPYVFIGTEGRGFWRASLPSADLSVTKADSPDPVAAGSDLTYTVTVTNNGPDPAPNATMVDDLPGGVDFTSVTPPAGWTCSSPAGGSPNGEVRCSTASMPVGAAVFTIVVTPPSSTADGAMVTNSARAFSAALDGSLGDNDDSETTTVIRQADIEASKVDSVDPAPRGGEFTYTVTATNNGPSDAANVTITDDLPPEVEFVSAAPSAGGLCGATPAPGDLNGTVECSWAGDTAAGDSRSVVITVRVHPPVAEGVIMTNTATVSSDETDPAPGNDEVTETTEVGPPECTITGSGSIYGTDGDDVICGSDGRDRIYAGDGDDLIFAYGSYDRVYGQGGNDEIVGDDGSDLLYGGTGDDEIWGLGGGDRLYGQSGFDELDGGADADRCYTQTDGGTTTDCEAGG